MRAIFRLTILGMLLTAIGASAQGVKTSTPDITTIVSRMQTEMADLNHDLAYSVTREYTLTPENARNSDRVVAQVNTVASGKKDYTITQGSGQAESVVRKVLDHEADASVGHTNGALSPANYAFALLGTETVDGHACYVIGLTPRHDSKDVLRGKAWVDSESYLIRQIAGSPAKSPSWWIKDVQITLHYRDIQGVWVQDSTKAVAQVRIVGKHTLASRAVDVRTNSVIAAKSDLQKASTRRKRRVDPAMLGAGVFQHR